MNRSLWAFVLDASLSPKITMKKIILIAVVPLVSMTFTSCETTGTGALLGGAAGAGVGAIVGNNTGLGTGAGVALGAGTGALVGGAHGRQSEKINQLRDEQNTFVVNVPNSDGSYLPVHLRRVNGGWQAPRGEVYPNVPSAGTLSRRYGY